jgi:hypothetical protein
VIGIFAGAVVLLVMALTTLWDRAKQNAKLAPEIEVAEPSFPVPRIPSSNSQNNSPRNNSEVR